MRAGETLISSTPMPTSSGSSSGSPAASPHTSTGIPADRAAAITRAISLITAGWYATARSATSGFCRSAASVYWTRSLVPIDRKSQAAAIG